MRTSSRSFLTPLCAALLAAVLASGDAAADPVPFDSDRWTFDAQESRLEEYLGKPSLMLRGGKAWVEDEPFIDGVVEFDVAFSAHFANFRYRKVDSPTLAGSPGEAPAPVPGAITRWQVSSVFERSHVAAKIELTEEDDAGLTWVEGR